MPGLSNGRFSAAEVEAVHYHPEKTVEKALGMGLVKI